MADSFTPLKDRVLLRRIDGAATTKSGLALPDTVKEKPTECEVVAVSAGFISEYSGVEMLPPVKVGDRVLIGKYSGSQEIKLDGVEHIAVKWDELIGILKKETVQ